jgi:hypothetical protein
MDDIGKKLPWERSLVVLEAKAKVLELEKLFSGSLNGDGNGSFSFRNGGVAGPCISNARALFKVPKIWSR